MKMFLALLAVIALGFAACNSDDGMSTQAPQQSQSQSSSTINQPNIGGSTADSQAYTETGDVSSQEETLAPEMAESCHPTFVGQTFRVVSASGRTIVSNVRLQNCSGLQGEVRRKARGIREFVGDVARISGNTISINPG